jgi:hypothetical protein
MNLKFQRATVQGLEHINYSDIMHSQMGYECLLWVTCSTYRSLGSIVILESLRGSAFPSVSSNSIPLSENLAIMLH